MTTIDKILIGIAGFTILFTITMIVLFCIFQAIPDTLIECYFSLIGSELILNFGIWWIKKTHGKEKHGNDNRGTD